ncbi:MAG: hypothetical protein JSR76_01495 [Verrucomicrobia bacterium]|nr:hypothetical protein [Verrucomicrobiota bacterium]
MNTTFLEKFLSTLPLNIDRYHRKIWNAHDKDQEFSRLGELLDDCEYVILFEHSILSNKQYDLLVQFYIRFEAFYQDCDRLDEYDQHPEWEGIVQIGQQILENFRCKSENYN